MSADIIHLTGGIDVGNGYVKGAINATETDSLDTIDLPSAVQASTRQSPKVPLDDHTALEVMKDESLDIYNRLDASFTSPLIGDSDRRVFGRSALTMSGSKFTEFEVHGHTSKVDQALSKILVLGVFATKALRDYVRETGALPDHELRVKIRAGLALPISEFVARRHAYAAEFMGGVHLVTIKNFSTPVTVRMEFTDVQVIAEGASAQFAITDKGEPLAEALLADLRSREPEALEGVTGADLVAVSNTVGIDVGEGTVNFPTFSGGRFNPEASTTLEMGYGTVLAHALERLDEYDLRFTSRKQLADFLQTTPTKFTRGRHQRAQALVEPDVKYLVEAITQTFGEVLGQSGESTEAVYVYGGGSGPIKEELYPALLAAAGDVPVLYLDAHYSRHLNREGLYIAARHVEERAQPDAENALRHDEQKAVAR
ncbi:ParM/StbA family protein [Streptomyces sp. NRRL F-5053]|uniref:ParM/StbA family protein n=1 Tax=Streptomyces sp. NRRL F-5053 TaxID=1463854 RepID=UPI0004C63B90|nr:ParM/StbA family protein [Streptomyces sp. NRRL F-5053]